MKGDEEASLRGGRKHGYRIAPSAIDRWLTDSRATRHELVTIGPRHLLAAVATAAAAAAVVLTLGACGGETKTVTQPASTAPLGRQIGGDSRTTAVADTRARTAARAFLTSYLNISYGRADPDTLRNASSALRAQQRAQKPRVPPGVRSRRPRITALRLEAAGDRRLRAIATVEDGDVAPYPLFATLAPSSASAGWVAVSVGG